MTYDEIIKNINIDYITEELMKEDSYKFEVDTRGRVISINEKLNLIEKFILFLNEKGLKSKVDLGNPKRVFIIIENNYTGMKYFGKLIAGRDGKIIKTRKCKLYI